MARTDGGESGVSNLEEDDEASDVGSHANLASLVRTTRETDSMGVSRTKLVVSFYEVNLNRLLGKGSYGKVCLAKKSASGKTYACKVMDIEQAPHNFVERFLPHFVAASSSKRNPSLHLRETPQYILYFYGSLCQW